MKIIPVTSRDLPGGGTASWHSSALEEGKVVARVVDQGVDIGVVADNPSAGLADIAEHFERIARSVRQLIAMERP